MSRNLMLVAMLFMANLLSAQILEPVKWSFGSEKISESEYLLTFTAAIEEGWTVYSQFTSDDGPVPTEITFESEGAEKVGKGEEIGHMKEGMDPYFDVNVIKFLDDEPFVIKQKVNVQAGVTRVTGFLTFMACDASKCLPPTDVDFNIGLANEAPAGGMTISGVDLGGDIGAAMDFQSPVQWSYEIEDKGSGEYILRYTAMAEDGWSVYSQFTEDDGPVPTTVDYIEEDHYKILDRSIEKGHRKEGIDPMFDVNVIKFLSDEPYVIEHIIKTSDPSKDINGVFGYMTCDDSKCLNPPYVDLVFNPSKLKAGEKDVSSEIASLIREGNVVDNQIPSIKSSLENPTADCGGVQELSTNLWLTFLFGFIGGLLALLTPCVFPMIPLTVSFFTKDTKRKGWVNGAIYGASIIVIYVALGIFLTAFFGADALNRLSTNWIANTIFFLIFIFFAFSFFGYYEITLPSSWSNKSDKMADKGGFLGIFFMAFTLAIVSFSCTGPIIGSAIVESASSKIGPAVVMSGFAFALAIPFGLFAAFPAWLNTLPKSGSWMTSVKVVLGFIELALAFKFLSVADLTNHWGFLRYELFMGIWILTAIALVLYLMGYIRFPHDAPLKKINPLRWGFIAIFAAAAVYLATGFMYNERTEAYASKALLSGIAPPAHYNFFLPEPKLDPELSAKYISYKKCANNLDCFTDYYEGLSYAKEVNKPVFLDFTGHGCVNCRKTEEHIWVKDEVYFKLKEDFVLVSLYCDDDKNLEETLISKSRNTKIRDVGNMWTDFQVVNFGSNSQPLYGMMTPDEQMIGKPRGYQPGVKGYVEFLECGLNNFNSQKILLGSK